MNAKAGVGINCQNSSNCIITRNRIINTTAASYGIAIRAYEAGIDAAGSNIVADNIILNGNPAGGTAAIAVDCEFTGDATTYWKANFAPRPIAVHNRNNLIANNVTDGFGYGFEGDGLSDSVVSGNQFRNNSERGIIVAHGATNLSIVGNVITECASSGIHLTYGTNHCLVKGNTVRTTVNNGGEALLQAYVGATDNVFEGNKLYGEHANGPQYHIYFAVHASRNAAVNNDCFGQCTKAYLAIENAWNTTTTIPYARGSSVATGELWANAASADGASPDTAFVGNRINGASAKPAIALIQSKNRNDGTGTAIGLSRVVVKDNVVVGTAYNYQLALSEVNSGSLSGAVLNGNAFAPAATVSNFTLTRGRAHFADWGGNAVLDAELQGGTVIDVGAIAGASFGVATVTVTGAAAGDILAGWGTSAILPVEIIIFGGQITATDTVVLNLFNSSGSSVDPASMTYYATVRKRLF